MAAPRVVDGAGARGGDIKRIHVIKSQLGWDDDTYRDVIATVCQGKRSSTELDVTARQRLLEHMQACLRRDRPELVAKAGQKARRKPLSARGRKIWSLWQQLGKAELVRQATSQTLNAWIARHTGCMRIEWLKEAQEVLVIESLKAWLERRNEPAQGAKAAGDRP